MTQRSDSSIHQHVRIVYVLFLAATVASFGYCSILGEFNGDFFPQPVFISVGMLLVILVASLAPYVFAWRLAGIFDRLPPRATFVPLPSALLAFLLIGFVAHIAATLLYGVGVMDQETYTAPPWVMPFIQLLNRLDPFYLGAFFILATPKRASTDLLAVVLMLSTGLLRAGLGVFNYIIIALCCKYSVELLRLFRRMPWLAIAGASALPAVISSLYQFRSQLRGDIQYDFSLSELLFGRFVGRLSSFSNVAFIQQNNQSFEWASKVLEPFYYAKQGLSSLLGSSFAPGFTPERLLIAGNRSYEGYSTFMAGIPGNLMMAWDISPWIAAFNLMLITGSVAAILWMSRYFGSEKARSFGLAMLFYPLTSGVANEFALLLVNTVIFLAFSVVFRRTTNTVSRTYAV